MSVCDACGGLGYLLEMTSGRGDVPEGWSPVQACGQCSAGRGMSDEEAARYATSDRDDIDRPLYHAFFPGDGDDVHDVGEWAIGPRM